MRLCLAYKKEEEVRTFSFCSLSPAGSWSAMVVVVVLKEGLFCFRKGLSILREGTVTRNMRGQPVWPQEDEQERGGVNRSNFDLGWAKQGEWGPFVDLWLGLIICTFYHRFTTMTFSSAMTRIIKIVAL